MQNKVDQQVKTNLKTRIIPCLDIKEGRVVKGTNFKGIRDAGDPVELAKKYSQSGADEISFLDINASFETRSTLYKLVREVAMHCNIPFSVGGGVREIEDVRKILLSGADKVSIGTSATSKPELITESANRFGAQCVIVSLDIAMDNEDGQYKLFTHGGRNKTEINAIEFAEKLKDLGVGEILINSIDCDGVKNGFNHDLNKKIREVTTLPIIASGGAGKVEHFADAVLEANVDAVLAASVFHFGEIDIQDVKRDMAGKGVQVRG